jgi:hypothetical protein
MNSLILLSGPVGAGKTTVARELIATSQSGVAYIEGDVFWSFIAKPVADRPRNENFKTITRAMFRSALVYVRDGYEAILDFTIPPWFLPAAQERVKDVAIHYVVLLPAESVCAARAGARPAGAISDYTPYRDLYEAFRQAERFAVRNDELDPAAAAAQIREGMKTGKFQVAS